MSKMLARRLFARAAIGVPTALKLGAGHPPPPSSGYGPPINVGGMDDAAMAVREKVWGGLRLQMKPEEERNQLKWTTRNMMGGLDPDLSVLNSMALQHRVKRQVERDVATLKRHQGLRATIIRALGGKPEDFE